LRHLTRLARVTVATGVAAALVIGAALPASAAPDGRPAQTIAWAPCADDPTADCGTLSVPIDWSKPNGAKFDLALARRKATDPAQRIGSLVVNPGGPGGSGVGEVLFGADDFSEALRSHFDLVGFDPRGVGRSHAVQCSADLLAQMPEPVFGDKAAYDKAIAYNRALGDDCRANTGPLFDHVDTLSVVKDLDAIRAAVGDKKLSYYGVSYGTLIGQQYAETFPGNVRAVTIDSNMDHSLGTDRFMVSEAVTAQDSFEEFVKGCSAAPQCALYGEDIKAVFRDLLARADRGELYDPNDPSFKVSAFLLVDVAHGSFYGPDWFGLAQLLKQLEDESSAALKADAKAMAPGELQRFPIPVFCEDWNLPIHGYGDYTRLLKEQKKVAPDMRYSTLAMSVTVACQNLGVKVNNPQHPLRVRGSAPLLELNAIHDPATAYSWAVGTKAQLGNEARFVTYEGWGHGTYGRSDCLTGTVDAYLISGKLPKDGMHCAAVQPEPPTAGKKAPLPSTTPRRF
jgi:pimeloyl-ACP methyl ester carboxylesterase